MLTAGDRVSDVRTLLGSLVSEYWVSAAEWAAREEAQLKLVGTYENKENNSTLSLTLDPEKPGLGVTYSSRGKPFNKIIQAIRGAGGSQNAAKEVDVRIYDMGTKDGARRGWRASIESLPYDFQQSRKPYHLGGCPTWFVSSSLQLGGVGLDDFEVVVDGEGVAVEVVNRGMRERLKRV